MISTIPRAALTKSVTNTPKNVPFASAVGSARHTSNSASATYLNAFQRKGFDYIQEMGGEKFPLLQYPQMISNALKTEAVASLANKQSLTHSTPATLRPAISLITQLSACNLNTTNAARSYFQEQLRVFSPEYADRTVEQKKLFIERLLRDGIKDDKDQGLTKLIISANYALFSNPIKGESSAYYLAKNWMSDKDPKNGIKIAILMIQEALKSKGFSDVEIADACLAYQPLLEEYMNLPLGDLYILSIPNQILPRIVFDSRAYGFPTDKNPQEALKFVDQCGRLINDGGHQARVVISEQVLHATNGVDVVYVNDNQKVKHYTASHILVPPEEVEVFAPFNLGRKSEIEESYQEQKKALDIKCKVLEEQILNRTREYSEK